MHVCSVCFHHIALSIQTAQRDIHILQSEEKMLLEEGACSQKNLRFTDKRNPNSYLTFTT